MTSSSDYYISQISSWAKILDVPYLTNRVLFDNPKFIKQSGSHSKDAHHYGEGGLLKHTYEVIELCMSVSHRLSEFNESASDKKLANKKILFLAALYHDFGKCWDYDSDVDSSGETIWKGNNHRRTIHHIQRSAIEWERVCMNPHAFNELKDIDVQAVTHCILSHHGRRDYGSPVAPYSREAWILHFCDSISARNDDCDRLDIVKIQKM